VKAGRAPGSDDPPADLPTPSEPPPLDAVSFSSEEGTGIQSLLESVMGRPGGASRKISRAAVTVALFASLCTLGSTLKEVLVADWFGRGDAIEAFLIAFLLPFLVVRVVAGAFDSALVPTLIHLNETEGRGAARRLFSSVMTVAVILFLVVSVLLVLLAPYYMPLLGSGFDLAKLRLTTQLLYILLVYLIVGGVVTIWSAVLNALEQFALPAFTPLLTPVTIIVFVVAAGETWGIQALVLGTVTGTLLEAVLLGRALKAQGLPLKPKWHGMDIHVRHVAGQYGAMVAAMLLLNGTLLVDRSMAAMLEGGSVAALNYGNKAVGAILGITAMGLYAAVLPYFSQMVASKDWKGCRQALKTSSRLALFATLPVTAAVVLFSHPIVKLLFERGAFTPADTDVVSGVQALYALQIPFFVLAVPFSRALSSLGGNSRIMFAAAGALGLDIVLNLLFMKYFGVLGIALSTSVVHLLLCVFLAVSTIRLLERVRIEK